MRFGGTVSLCSLLVAAQSAFGIQAQIMPEEVGPGSFAVLKVRGLGKSGSVSFRGAKYPLFPCPEGMRALIPVGLGSPPGTEEVIIEAGMKKVTGRLCVKGVNRGPPRRLKGIRVESRESASLAEAGRKFRAVISRVTDQAFWGPVWRVPVPGRVTSRFGIIRVYEGGASWPHRGVDLASPSGWPVLAANAGWVRLAERLGPYGNAVILDHGQTVFTCYLHMKRIAIGRGQDVAAGQVLGTVGETGLARGPHLHLGAYISGTAVDPLELLARGLPYNDPRGPIDR